MEIIEYVLLIIIGITLSQIFNKLQRRNITASFAEAVQMLNVIIQMEIAAYEDDVFSRKQTLSNLNFEFFYKDLTNKIIKAIAPSLMKCLTIYMTEDHIYTMIARAVKIYLTQKI